MMVYEVRLIGKLLIFSVAFFSIFSMIVKAGLMVAVFSGVVLMRLIFLAFNYSQNLIINSLFKLFQKPSHTHILWSITLAKIPCSLPNYQLSFFCIILQILFGYMHPIVSGDQVSNWIHNEWRFENHNGQIVGFGIALLGWDIIWIHWTCRIMKSMVKLKPWKMEDENWKRVNPCRRIHPFQLGYFFEYLNGYRQLICWFS